MNKRAIILGLMSLLLTLGSCAQTTKKQENMSTEYRDKIKNIYKEVKRYDYNPTYQVRDDKFNCPMEIYINDVLAYYSNSEGKSAGEQNIDIPQYILKSGKQSIRIKIFPLLDKNKNFEKFVSKNALLTLRIVHGEYEDMKNWKNFKEVFRVQLPKVTVDVPYIELKGEFEAVVPYELEGWSNGVDLSKEDPKKLEEEVLGRLKEIANLYENKEIEGLAREQYKYLREYDQAMYNNKIENSEEWEKTVKSSLNESIKTELLNGKMKIMGKGKVVTVLIESGADKNEGVIRNETEEEYLFYAKYFYRPAAGARLEVIR